jgi:hypothetical protein
MRSKKGIPLLLIALMLMAVLIPLIGCGRHNPNLSILKIEITEPKDRMFNGELKVDKPKSAGFPRKTIEIRSPGSIEMKAGPSSYELKITNWSNDMKLKIYVDGRELVSGTDLAVANDPRSDWTGVFEIKEKTAP